MKAIYAEDNLRKLYQEVGSGPKIANLLNVPYKVLARYLKKYGITHNAWTNGAIQENYFVSLDTENKAYFAGFFFADGYVAKDLSRFQINIGECDSYILDQFIKDSNSNYKVKFYKAKAIGKEYSSCKLTVCNSTFIKNIVNLGIVPGKKNRITLPDVSDAMLPHFIRGIFDADGCFSWSHIKRNNPLFSFQICGYYPIIEQVENLLYDLNIYCNIGITGNIYKLESSRRKTVCDFGHFLYDNASVYLQRKKDKYDTFIHKYFCPNMS